MALIDLKNVNFYLRDGFDNGSATPTTTAIEPVAETDIALSGCTIAVPEGAGVKFGSDDEEYTVASRTISGGTDAEQTLTSTVDPTGGTFTLTFGGDETDAIAYDASAATIELNLEALDSVPNGSIAASGTYDAGDVVFTFSGGLEGAQSDMVLDATSLTGGSGHAISTTATGVLGNTTTEIVLTSGLEVATTVAGSVEFKGIKLEIEVGEGNLEYTEKKTREFKLNRGNLNLVKNADDEPMDVNFAFEWEYLKAASGGSVPTIEDALKRTGPAAAWTNAASDPCSPYCVHIEIHNVPVCTGAGLTDTTEDILLTEFYYEELAHSVEDSQISCSGRCNSIESDSSRY